MMENDAPGPPPGQPHHAPPTTLRGKLYLWIIDGRSVPDARLNASFAKRRRGGYWLASAAPSFLLLLIVAIFWFRPMVGPAEALDSMPVSPPLITKAQSTALAGSNLYRQGVLVGRLPPWGVAVPQTGMSSVSDSASRLPLEAAIGRTRLLGAEGDNRLGFAASGPRHVRATALIEEFRKLDAKLGLEQTITPYHRGVLSLWIGDYDGASIEFTHVLELVDASRNRTPTASPTTRMRLDSLEAAALYGRGLAEASTGDLAKATASIELAIEKTGARIETESSPRLSLNGAAEGKAAVQRRPPLREFDDYRAVDLRTAVLDRGDHLAPLDVGDMRSDLIALQLRSGRRDVANRIAKPLFSAGAASANPALSANLQLLAAGRGERDQVRKLQFKTGRYISPEERAAQSLARSAVGLPPVASGVAEPSSKLSDDLRRIQYLRDGLQTQLRAGALARPTPSDTVNDPVLFARWEEEVALKVGEGLLAHGMTLQGAGSAQAQTVYDLIIANADWLPWRVVADASLRRSTGCSMLGVGVALALALLLMLLSLRVLGARREAYRDTMESLHRRDRLGEQA